MKTQHRIRKIAKNVRTWAEELQNEKLFWDRDLGGMCAIASYELFKRLRRAKLKPVICVAPGHAFVQCKDLVIDVTATQFNSSNIFLVNSPSFRLKPIEIRKAKEASKVAHFWKPLIKINDKKTFVNEMQNWSRDEIHPELLNLMRS